MIYHLTGALTLHDGPGSRWHGAVIDTACDIDLTAEVPADSPRAALRAVAQIAAAGWGYRYLGTYDVDVTDEEGRVERLKSWSKD